MIIILSLILVVQIISLSGPYVHGMALQAILSKNSSLVFWWAFAGFLILVKISGSIFSNLCIPEIALLELLLL